MNLLQTHPELCKQWHPTKNGDLKPENFTHGSHKKVWWKCPVADDHEWIDSISHLTQGRKCPFCYGNRATLKNCLSATHPEIVKQWHPTKNRELKPENFTYGSGVKVWWKCPEADDHEWQASIDRRTGKEQKCPYCVGQRVANSNCLPTTHPEIAKQWHPTKNGKLKPEDVTAGSGIKVWWKCPEADDHEWQASIDRRTGKEQKCPYCVGQRVANSNCLPTTHPEIAKQWHPTKNGKLKPEDVTAGSGIKVWWKCTEADDHEWQAVIADRKNKGCSCCRGLTVVNSNCLSTTHPEIAKQWHPTKNGELKPEQFTAGSNKKVWWKCSIHAHEWLAMINDRSGGRGCPRCKASRGEKKIALSGTP
jgi:hypothetical protein